MKHNLDEQYYRILCKCETYPEFADKLIKESSIRALVVEKIDPVDIKATSNNLKKTRKALNSLRSYADQLQLQTELEPMYDYIDALTSAIDKAESQLANVSFDSGVVSSFLGQKMSLPQITSAAIKLNTKAVDFGRGFLSAMNKIKGGLESVLKDADKADTLADAIGTNPDLNLKTISKGIEDELTKALGGTLFAKVGSFFSKARLGKEADIMSVPGMDVDMKALAKTIANEIMAAKVENLLGKAPPAPPPETLVTDLADEMEDTVDQAQASDAEGDKEETPDSETPEKVDDNLENAVKDARDGSDSPLDAALDAIDTWSSSLSKSSQGTLKGAGRLDSLKGSIRARLEDSASAVEGEIKDAIASWRAENEETLIKSKRFAKKNFDSLEELVPQLAAFMLKQTSEVSAQLDRAKIRTFVFSYLGKMYSKRLNEQRLYRWQKLAGIINE